MLFFGNITNNFLLEKFNFKLEVDFNAPFFNEFYNDKLRNGYGACLDGYYTLIIEQNNKTIYESDGMTQGELHPVEILNLINDNWHWDLEVDEVYSDLDSEKLPLQNTADWILQDETEISDDRVFDEFFSEIFHSYTNDLLSMIKNDCSDFHDLFESIEWNFYSGDMNDTEYIYQLAREIVDEYLITVE